MNSFPDSRFFTWDFWYYFDSKTKIFHILFLNAPIETLANNQHHFNSQIGYAQTLDFENFTDVNYCVFTANPNGWDNTSIWSGDVIAYHDKFLFFYTSRDKNIDDGMTQNIGLAISSDFINWQRLDLKITPDEDLFLTKALKTEDTTHAWRDPFLFNAGGRLMMLLSAKSNSGDDNKRGAVALLAAENNRFDSFVTIASLLEPNCFGEMEVPQMFIDENGLAVIGFSCLSKQDTFSGTGGFYAIKLPNKPSSAQLEPELILPQTTGIYAARVIPELGGEIIGFDLEKGGIKKSGKSVLWQHPNRNFDEFIL